jgi:hypothetical protein
MGKLIYGEAMANFYRKNAIKPLFFSNLIQLCHHQKSVAILCAPVVLSPLTPA